MTAIKHFNIRVYALIVDEKNRVLLSDEYRFGMKMTKFPGGGMKFGEGTLDCIQREALEEFGQKLKIHNHFYTTDFFQQAMFFEDHQLISIYYLASFDEEIKFSVSEIPFDFELKEEGQSFRWKHIDKSLIDELSFPIDKKVGEMLIEEGRKEIIHVRR